MNIKEYFSSAPENLWKRNLAVLTIAQFISMVGMTAAIPFLPLYVRELGVTNPEEAKVWSGLVMAATTFAGALFAPFWGYIGDRFGRKAMNVRASIGLTITILMLGYVSNVEELFVVRLLLGALSGVIASALAFVTANTPNEKSGFAIGVLQSSISAASIVGPFIGGTIADATGIRPVFNLIAVLCFISAILLIIYLNEERKDVQKVKHTMLENIKYVYNHKNLLYLLLFVTLAQVGIQLSLPIFAFFVESLQAPSKYLATITGLLFAVVAFFSIIFAPKWGRRNDKKDWRKTVFVASSIVGICALLQAFAPNYLYLFPLRIVIGIFVAAIIPSLYSAINRAVPMEIKGGVMGIASSSNMTGTFIAYLSSGYIASYIGLQYTIALSGIILISVGLFSKNFVKD